MEESLTVEEKTPWREDLIITKPVAETTATACSGASTNDNTTRWIAVTKRYKYVSRH